LCALLTGRQRIRARKITHRGMTAVDISPSG
jgi:hypothetical protein